ncbi:Cyclin-dependent kinase G-2, partial [Bienertia sinuspersici]
MVMEYIEHDLKGIMETMKQPFSQSETLNLLLNNQGDMKICDFGLAHQYRSPLKPYTHLVVTLWYRAPELLLGAKVYSTAVDMWSLNCIMADLLSKESLFNGKSEYSRILGTPNETIWPGFSKLPGVKVNFVKHQLPALGDSGLAFLASLRITADAALKHGWFCEVPLPKSKEFMPTFPSQLVVLRRVLKSPDPWEEQHRRELQQAELGGIL